MSGIHDKFACSLLPNNITVRRREHEADSGTVSCPPGELLVIAIDTLVEGVHYRPESRADDVAWKALSVNLSDLAAMGASARTAAVSIAMPASERRWLKAFCRGLESVAARYSVEVIAATVISGAGIVTMEVCGGVPHGLALTRGGARAGDGIYVTGTLGDAGLALRIIQENLVVPNADAEYLIGRLDRPTPRLAAGCALRGVASAAIDVSDGLAGDLDHVLCASGVGASVEIERLPRSHQFGNNTSEADAHRLAASGGDDYELCFTVPVNRQEALQKARQNMDVQVTRIGVIETRPGLRFLLGNGNMFDAGTPFDHFK